MTAQNQHDNIPERHSQVKNLQLSRSVQILMLEHWNRTEQVTNKDHELTQAYLIDDWYN